MNENWCALCIAIMNKNMSIDKALSAAGISAHGASCKGKRKPRYTFTDKDVQEMIALRERKFTYKEIGEHFGVKFSLVYMRIKRYEEKLKKSDGLSQKLERRI